MTSAKSIRFLVTVSCIVLCAAVSSRAADSIARSRPNILWVLAEDSSPNLGCYGDLNARTPNLDRFAQQGVRYNQVHSIHSACSPSRSCLASGVYPTRLGTFQHRGRAVVDPAEVRTFMSLLREAGYYCFNGTKGTNPKTDYNFEVPTDAWDKLGSKEIEWRNRPKGAPFFGQVTLHDTHQSQYGKRAPGAPSTAAPEHRHDPATIKVPPYHPDTAAAREIWAEYHERLTLVDSQFQQILDWLREDNLLDDTIVFFFGDNGNGIPGGKVWLWAEGPHVPLLVWVPKKWRAPGQAEPGSVTDRLVSFIDFAPTALALADVKIPASMPGQPFLGPKPAPARRYVYAARDFNEVTDIDSSRMVRDQNFHYIRNFMPHLAWNAINYSWLNAPYFLESWRRAALEGKTTPDNRQSAFFRLSKPAEELYDLRTDPHCLRNLAADPASSADLARLRAECRRWMLEQHDLGLLSLYEFYRRTGPGTPYALAADPARNPTARLLDAADLANARDPKNLPALEQLMRDPDNAIRRWAAIGFLALGQPAAPAIATLERGLTDDSPDVRVACAEAMMGLGRVQTAAPILIALLSHESGIIRAETLLALARIGPAAKDTLPHLGKALIGGTHRNVWSNDNLPDLVAIARAAIADPEPPRDGPLPALVPLKARRFQAADIAAPVSVAEPYLKNVITELTYQWPKNRTINIVCHGHSVPSGYARSPHVRPFDAYPHLLRVGLSERFPTAVCNVIITAIGGEQSEKGAARFETDVLPLRPDVVTIDYALNDRRLGLDRAELAWRNMIETCVSKKIPVILLTPTADSRANLADPEDPLNQHARQIRRLAAEYKIPLVDSLAEFNRYVSGGGKLDDLLSQNNHPNLHGHRLVAAELLKLFPEPFAP